MKQETGKISGCAAGWGGGRTPPQNAGTSLPYYLSSLAVYAIYDAYKLHGHLSCVNWFVHGFARTQRCHK